MGNFQRGEMLVPIEADVHRYGNTVLAPLSHNALTREQERSLSTILRETGEKRGKGT